MTISPTANDEVIIVGGGLAGLAAAVGLAKHGVRATVLESRPRLGGRASSFQDVASGQWIDNCQHVTMGCCTNFRRFCALTGLSDFFQREEVLYFIAPDGRVNRFEATSLPAPCHLLSAFRRLSYLTLAEKLALARGLRALARERRPDRLPHIQAWLKQHRQPPRVVDRFWHVVLVSALSESLERISVAAARQVITEGFLNHRDAWKMEVPKTPLETLYGSRLIQWLREHGASVELQAAAAAFDCDDQHVQGLRLRDGNHRGAADYIIAVPHHRLAALLPPSLSEVPYFANVQQLETAPISSIHLWFDRAIMPLPHAVFVEGIVHWIFDRSRFIPPTDEEQSRKYYQVVISASRDLIGQSTEAIRDQVLKCLAVAFPEVQRATLLGSRQVTEHKAVFSPLTGSGTLRPPQQSPLVNLQLAGDYTTTGWPATMEGAVRSGFLAAENVLRRRGIHAALVQDRLPIAPLSRWLFG